MEIDKLLGRLRDRVWREFLNWTWEQRIVGLCLSAALSLFVGTMQDMSPGVMSLFVLVSTACVLATISWIRKSSVHVAAIEPVQQRIRALAGMIPGVDLVTRAVETSGATLLQGPRDWKKETVAGLRGMVRIRLVGEYGMCLAGDQPNEPARQFLLALSASLTADDLRQRDSHESVPNDQRSKEAGLTTTGPTEFSEMATLLSG